MVKEGETQTRADLVEKIGIYKLPLRPIKQRPIRDGTGIRRPMFLRRFHLYTRNDIQYL